MCCSHVTSQHGREVVARDIRPLGNAGIPCARVVASQLAAVPRGTRRLIPTLLQGQAPDFGYQFMGRSQPSYTCEQADTGNLRQNGCGHRGVLRNTRNAAIAM
jgi:hypothetical protein